MSHIVVLHGSARRQGNTAQLVQAFVRGAEAAGHQVTVLSIATLNIHPCIGCERCAAAPDHACFQKDDMTQVYAALAQADTLIVASPVYFYGISAQLKALIDRLHTPLAQYICHQTRSLAARFRQYPARSIRCHSSAIPHDPALLQHRRPWPYPRQRRPRTWRHQRPSSTGRGLSAGEAALNEKNQPRVCWNAGLIF